MKKLTLALALICATLTIMAQNPQCKAKRYDAKLKDSVQCRMPSNFIGPNGYCPAHNPDLPRCGATKKDGQQCRMRVDKAGDRCRFHPMKTA